MAQNTIRNLLFLNTRPSTSKTCDEARPLDTLERIDKEVAPIVWPPYNGAMIGPVKVKRLQHGEISECGEFSLIETFYDKVRAKEIKEEDIAPFAKIQHAILKKAMISPTYDEVLKVVGQYNNLEKCMELIEAFRLEVSDEPEGPKKNRMRKELRSFEAQYYTVLPGDFIGFIMAVALGIDQSDIKTIGEEILLEAANLAKLNNNRPSDNVGGRFSDFNKADIDKRAWAMWYERNKENNAGRRRNSNRAN